MTRGAVMACCLVAAGCAGKAQAPPEVLPEVLIIGLVMENRTTTVIAAARLLVPATGQFVSCSNILPRSRCSTGFPEQRYTGNAFEMTWSQGGGIWSTGPLQIGLSEDVIDAGRARVRAVITGPGSAWAELVPDG